MHVCGNDTSLLDQTFINTESCRLVITPDLRSRAPLISARLHHSKISLPQSEPRKTSRKLSVAHFPSLGSAKQKRKRGRDGGGGGVRIENLDGERGYPLSATFSFQKDSENPPRYPPPPPPPPPVKGLFLC